MRWIALFLAMICGNIWAKELIVYPQPESEQDQRGVYAVELLKLALAEAGVDAELRPAHIRMMQERTFSELKHGRTLDVVWAMTSDQRELDALPIRIPIYKGLIGWRIPLVHAQRAHLLANVADLNDLKSFTAGQATDWPDTGILRANGLPVTTTSTYANLFKMLTQARFDYMPRSVVEVGHEARTTQAKSLVVDSHIVLHYPSAAYFFVNRHNAKLAQWVETGLEKAVSNGKFDRLFYKHHGKLIEQANLKHRRMIRLDNPDLPKDTPLHRKELWLPFPDGKAASTR